MSRIPLRSQAPGRGSGRGQGTTRLAPGAVSSDHRKGNVSQRQNIDRHGTVSFESQITQYRSSLSTATTGTSAGSAEASSAVSLGPVLNFPAMGKRRIAVVVRKKPFDVALAGLSQSSSSPLDLLTAPPFTSPSTIVQHVPTMKLDGVTAVVAHKELKFDAVFGDGADSASLFRGVVRPSLADLSDRMNMNVLFVAYGQTSSGKTHTLSNLMPGAVNEVFTRIHQGPGGRSPGFKASFLEVDGNDVVDLLSPDCPNVAVLVDGSGTVRTPGATAVPVATSAEAVSVLEAGFKLRASANTLRNAQSSRTHGVGILQWGELDLAADRGTPQPLDNPADSSVPDVLPGGPAGPAGTLMIVDLAGNETRWDSADHSEADKAKMKKINSALSVMKQCLCAIARSERHVPYRQHRVTMLMRNYFDPPTGSRSRVVLIGTVSPLVQDVEATTATLRHLSEIVTPPSVVVAKKPIQATISSLW